MNCNMNYNEYDPLSRALQFKFKFAYVIFSSQGDLGLKWDDLHFMGNSQWFIKVTVSYYDVLYPG